MISYQLEVFSQVRYYQVLLSLVSLGTYFIILTFRGLDHKLPGILGAGLRKLRYSNSQDHI